MEQLDIKKVIQTKNPRLASLLPRFFFRWLHSLLHIDDINYLLRAIDGKPVVEALSIIIEYTKVEYEVYGKSNLPTNKRVILVSNHPLGGLDGIILMKILGEHYGELKTVVNDLLMHLKPLEDFFIPVNKFKSQSKEHATIMNETFASSAPMLIFPAGLASRKTNEGIVDLEWKKSFLIKSREYQRDIVPIYFDAMNSKRFYRAARLRERLGIKFNLDQALLPREVFNKQGLCIPIYIGNPIDYQVFDSSRSVSDWIKFIREKTYRLKTDHELVYLNRSDDS